MRRLLLLMAIAVPTMLSGCEFPQLPVDIPMVSGPKLSDEEVIAAVLDDVHRGMQQRKVYKVLAHVSRNYRDAAGRDYDGMQEYLSRIFEDYRELRITRVPPKIFVQGYEAKAVETFGTVAEPFKPNEVPPVQLQGQVTVYLEKVDNRWLIVEWGNVL